MMCCITVKEKGLKKQRQVPVRCEENKNYCHEKCLQVK
jgi:hypothetical protein